MARVAHPDDKALQRRVLVALDKLGAIQPRSLCSAVHAPSQRILHALRALHAEGDVEELAGGKWRTRRRVGLHGGVRRGPACQCGGFGRCAFSAEGDLQWRCERCDARWPRYRRNPRAALPLDPTLRALSACARRGCRPPRAQCPTDEPPVRPPRPPSSPRLAALRVRRTSIQKDFILAAIHAAPKDGNGYTTTAQVFAAYSSRALPVPYLHVQSRQFRFLLSQLAQAGKIETHVGSRGRYGKTTWMRPRTAPPTATPLPAET